LGEAVRLAIRRRAGSWWRIMKAGVSPFPVDEVAQTIACAPGDQKPVPATLARSASSYTRGLVTWRDRTVGCLDAEALFDAFERCLA
jgi:chemotaxis signal transduction protein